MDYLEWVLFVGFLVGIVIMMIRRTRILYYFACILIVSVTLFVYRCFVYESIWMAFTESFGVLTIIAGIAGIIAWLQYKKNTRQGNQ